MKIRVITVAEFDFKEEQMNELWKTTDREEIIKQEKDNTVDWVLESIVSEQIKIIEDDGTVSAIYDWDKDG